MQQFYRKSSFFIFLWFVSTAIWGQITTVQGHIRDMKGRPLPNVRVLSASDSSRCQTNSEGYYQVPISEREIKPTLDLDPLNGVNTYDLILISRHILNLEPMNTPYKLISADASKTGCVTAFDIIELRKLILGTYQNLPNNHSWRFVDAMQVFTNPNNPFADVIKESINVHRSDFPRTDVNFIGCKIGDIDLSAMPNNRTARNSTVLGWPTASGAKGGEIRTFPIVYQGEIALEGIQFGLLFDPSEWELIGPSSGDIIGVDPSSFGLSSLAEGKIKFLWNMFEGESEAIQPGNILFSLSFKAKKDAKATALEIDYKEMYDGAWTHEGQEYALVHSPAIAERTNQVAQSPSVVTAMPNPTHGTSTLYFSSTQAGKVRLVLSDAFGRQLSFRDLPVGAGSQEIELTDLSKQPAGIYSWWLKLPNGTMHQGRIVKQ